jgi:hypothetical protein
LWADPFTLRKTERKATTYRATVKLPHANDVRVKVKRLEALLLARERDDGAPSPQKSVAKVKLVRVRV